MARECPAAGCGEITTGGRCERHSKQQAKAWQDSRHHERQYNQRRWKRTRKAYKASNPLCEMCLGKGKIKAAALVHHIVGVRKGGDWYRWDNLMSLCVACHGEEHKGDD